MGEKKVTLLDTKQVESYMSSTYVVAVPKVKFSYTFEL